MSFDPPQGNGNGNEPSPMMMGMILGGTYGTMGFCGIVPGILQIFAGIKVFKFQSRTLGIVSLFSGLATMLTCYCAPTSVALLIYGLIVLLNNSVSQAFELAKQGHSPDHIDLMFNPLYAQQQQQLKP
jgi:hypothetical protein